MANIALNKPSGGQLILSPEDGTSTETVTIPSVGVGKVLNVAQYKQSTAQTRDVSGVGTTVTDLATNYADIGGTSSITYNKVSDSSVLIIESIVHMYGDQSGGANKWAVMHQRILVNGSQVATTVEAPASDNAYGVAWNSTSTTSIGRSMNYSTLVGQASGIPAGSVDIRIQGTGGSSNTTFTAIFNSYGTGSIKVTEVAA